MTRLQQDTAVGKKSASNYRKRAERPHGWGLMAHEIIRARLKLQLAVLDHRAERHTGHTAGVLEALHEARRAYGALLAAADHQTLVAVEGNLVSLNGIADRPMAEARINMQTADQRQGE